MQRKPKFTKLTSFKIIRGIKLYIHYLLSVGKTSVIDLNTTKYQQNKIGTYVLTTITN